MQTRTAARRRPATMTVLSTGALAAWALAVAGPTLASCQPGAPAPDAWREELDAWRHPAPLPSFPLVDHTGQAFTLGDLKGLPTVVAFVFSRCAVPTACPLTMARLKDVQARMEAGAARFLVVTLDPAFDTPEVLAAFARRHGLGAPAFRFATGSREVVEALTSLFNVVALRRGAELDATPDLAHVVKLAVLDGELVPVREWLDNAFDPKEVVDAAIGQ